MFQRKERVLYALLPFIPYVILGTDFLHTQTVEYISWTNTDWCLSLVYVVEN